MPELDEFAEALMAQLSVEINEEKEIAQLAKKIEEDRNFTVEFDSVENISQKIFSGLVRIAEKLYLIAIALDLCQSNLCFSFLSFPRISAIPNNSIMRRAK